MKISAPPPAAPSLGTVATAFVLGGLGGWILENIVSGGVPRNSPLFGGHTVPFLPVYGLGAALVVTAAPHLQTMPILARGAVYAAGLSAVELGACAVDRALLPAHAEPSWDYGDGACVDVTHTVMWGLLGLGVEAITRA